VRFSDDHAVPGSQSSNWIDARTRAVFVEAVLLNPNYDYFMFVRLVSVEWSCLCGRRVEHHVLEFFQAVETPAVGGLVSSYQFEVTKLKKYLAKGRQCRCMISGIATDLHNIAADWGVLSLEIWVLILLVGHMMGEFDQLRASRMAYFASYYNILDVCICFVSDFILSSINLVDTGLTFCRQLAVMVIVLHSTLLSWESSIDWFDLDQFPPVHRISYWNTIETDVFSFLILLAWFKLLEFLSVFRKFSRLVVIFEMVSEEAVRLLTSDADSFCSWSSRRCSIDCCLSSRCSSSWWWHLHRLGV